MIGLRRSIYVLGFCRPYRACWWERVIPGLRHAFSVPYPGLFPFAPTGAPDLMERYGLRINGILDHCRQNKFRTERGSLRGCRNAVLVAAMPHWVISELPGKQIRVWLRPSDPPGRLCPCPSHKKTTPWETALRGRGEYLVYVAAV